MISFQRLLVLACLLSLAVADCPISSPSTCDFYKCVSQSCKCQASDYPMAYGYKFCSLFGTRMDKFSSDGQAWINAVRTCLQDALQPYVTPSSPKVVQTCPQITKIAFSSHVECYVHPGFGAKSVCNLSFLDWVQLFATIKGAFVDAFGETFTQMLLSARDCGTVWVSQVHLGAQATSTSALLEHTDLIQQYAANVAGLPLDQVVVYTKPKNASSIVNPSKLAATTVEHADVFITLLSGSVPTQLLAEKTADSIAKDNTQSLFDDADFVVVSKPQACGEMCDEGQTKTSKDWVPVIAGVTVGGAVAVVVVAFLVVRARRKRQVPASSLVPMESIDDLSSDAPNDRLHESLLTDSHETA